MRLALVLALLSLACGPARRDANSDEQGGNTPPELTQGGKRIFATSARYPANLRAAGGEADGLASADRLCTQAAEGALLGGTWRAWLSTSDVNAIDRIEDVGPWYEVRGAGAGGGDGPRNDCGGDGCPATGEKLFNNKAHLASTPLAPLTATEFGEHAGGLAWTGTLSGGRASGSDCGNWTSEGEGQGTLGFLSGAEWSNGYETSCNESHRLVCIEQ